MPNRPPLLLLFPLLFSALGAKAAPLAERELNPEFAFKVRSFEGTNVAGKKCAVSVLEQDRGTGGYGLTDLAGMVPADAKAPFAITLEDNAHRVAASKNLGVNGVAMVEGTKWEAKTIGTDYGHPTAVRLSITPANGSGLKKSEPKCLNLKLVAERQADRDFTLDDAGHHAANPAGKELAGWEAKTSAKQQNFCVQKAQAARVAFIEKSCASTPTNCAAADDSGDIEGGLKALRDTYAECLKKMPSASASPGKANGGEAGGATSAQ